MYFKQTRKTTTDERGQKGLRVNVQDSRFQVQGFYKKLDTARAKFVYEITLCGEHSQVNL